MGIPSITAHVSETDRKRLMMRAQCFSFIKLEAFIPSQTQQFNVVNDKIIG